MKLKCWLVRNRLAGSPPGEKLPGWVTRHMVCCEDCRKEAATYDRLGMLLRDNLHVGPCRLTSGAIRSKLLSFPSGISRRRTPIFAAVACGFAAVVLVLSLVNKDASVQVPLEPQKAAAVHVKRHPEVPPVKAVDVDAGVVSDALNAEKLAQSEQKVVRPERVRRVEKAAPALQKEIKIAEKKPLEQPSPASVEEEVQVVEVIEEHPIDIAAPQPEPEHVAVYVINRVGDAGGYMPL